QSVVLKLDDFKSRTSWQNDGFRFKGPSQKPEKHEAIFSKVQIIRCFSSFRRLTILLPSAHINNGRLRCSAAKVIRHGGFLRETRHPGGSSRTHSGRIRRLWRRKLRSGYAPAGA